MNKLTIQQLYPLEHSSPHVRLILMTYKTHNGYWMVASCSEMEQGHDSNKVSNVKAVCCGVEPTIHRTAWRDWAILCSTTRQVVACAGDLSSAGGSPGRLAN